MKKFITNRDILTEIEQTIFSVRELVEKKANKIVYYQPIIKNNYYELWYNIDKKRVYHAVKNQWNKDEIAEDYLQDLLVFGERIGKNTEINSVIIDIRKLEKEHTEKCREMQKEAQKKLVELKVKYICMLTTISNSETYKHIIKQHINTGVKIDAMFYGFDAADNWLDDKIIL